jgi:hypothetical protein
MPSGEFLDNVANLRAALGIPSHEELALNLTFENEDWWCRPPVLYAPIKQAKLLLALQTTK